MTRLGGRKERVFYLTPTSLHLSAIDGDVKVCVEVPVSDIYLREGLESFSFQFQKRTLDRHVAVKRTKFSKIRSKSEIHENLYLIIKTQSGHLEMLRHVEDQERRKGKQSLSIIL